MSDQSQTFNEILREALRHGLIDPFKLAFWYSNGTPADQITAEIRALALVARRIANG